MKFLAKLMTVALAIGATSAAAIPASSDVYEVTEKGVDGSSKPPPVAIGRCDSPLIRKEWRTLSSTQKQNFLDAVNCLKSAAPKLQTVAPGTSSRFEDFVVEHKIQAEYVHLVGHFLPWHRLFLAEYERVLRTECGYTGALPYWDYTLDSDNIALSPVFSATNGFGGNGVLPAGQTDYVPFASYCIGDGPFANWTINIAEGKGTGAGPRCLKRNISRLYGQGWLTAAREAEVKSKTSFGEMVWTLEGEPDFNILGMHGAGHWGIGGSVSDVYTSNSDPLFYLHHANLDRIWWEWQDTDLTNRLWDIDGSIIPRHPDILGGDYSGLPSGNVTLPFQINLGTLGGPSKHVKVQQVMDVKGGRPDNAPSSDAGVLCYKYAASPAASL